jgi:hypothetical protein
MASFLRPALLLTELTDTNLRLARQCGATDIVGPCPGFEDGALDALVQRIRSFGLRLSVMKDLSRTTKLSTISPVETNKFKTSSL